MTLRDEPNKVLVILDEKIPGPVLFLERKWNKFPELTSVTPRFVWVTILFTPERNLLYD
jgi:hypothetical protein